MLVANDFVLLEIFDQVDGVLDGLGVGFFLGAGAVLAAGLDELEKACPQVIGFQAETPLASSAQITVGWTIPKVLSPTATITRIERERREPRRALCICFMMFTPTRNLPTNPPRTVARSVRKVGDGIKVKK